MLVDNMEGALQVVAVQTHEGWSSFTVDHLKRSIAKECIGPVDLQKLPCDAVLYELNGAVLPKTPDVIDVRGNHRDN